MQAVCAESRVPNNQKCKLRTVHVRLLDICQSRPYWNPQYNKQQAYRHCMLRLTLTVTVNPKNTIICGFSCPLTLQLLLQILPQAARFPAVPWIGLLCVIFLVIHIIFFFFYATAHGIVQWIINRGSYMSAHVLLNLLNELRKRDKMRGLPSILSLFRNEFYKFNNTRARMLDSIYHMTNTLKSHF